MTVDLLKTLRAIVGDNNVLDSEQVSERASHYWDARPLTAKALVRPANTAQTAAVLAACHDARQSVVTQGGLTGLVEGHQSTGNDLILSLERQRQIERIDPVGRTITVGAGAILQDVQHAVNQAGLKLGLDLGARGSCTIGGNVSTNAGGLSVLRYGMAREQVLGLEAVLADGTILPCMNGMMKNNAGYDLKHLFIGSEGTLGIITRVVLRLRAATPQRTTALLAFNHFTQITQTLGLLDTKLSGTLEAFEVLWQPFYRLNTQPERSDTSRAPLHREYPLYAIVESRTSGTDAANALLEDALAVAMERQLIVDAVVAKSEKEAETIWYIREHIDIALQHHPVFVYDISLPIAEMESYTGQLLRDTKKQWPLAEVYIYGHLADGNLHILIAPLANSHDSSLPDNETSRDNKSVPYDHWQTLSNDLVYTALQSIGGSVSAEHGIGLLKKPYLELSRSDTEIALMKTLKRSLDPNGILNRGKIIDV